MKRTVVSKKWRGSQRLLPMYTGSTGTKKRAAASGSATIASRRECNISAKMRPAEKRPRGVGSF
eukprot:4219650-Prymnesium_polylepis.1